MTPVTPKGHQKSDPKTHQQLCTTNTESKILEANFKITLHILKVSCVIRLRKQGKIQFFTLHLLNFIGITPKFPIIKLKTEIFGTFSEVRGSFSHLDRWFIPGNRKIFALLSYSCLQHCSQCTIHAQPGRRDFSLQGKEEELHWGVKCCVFRTKLQSSGATCIAPYECSFTFLWSQPLLLKHLSYSAAPSLFFYWNLLTPQVIPKLIVPIPHKGWAG